MKQKRIFLFAAALAALLFLSGCNEDEKIVSEENEKAYRRATELLSEGRVDEAIQDFTAVIKKRDDAPASHFNLGHIHMTKLNDLVGAIYHFQKSIEEGEPNAQQVQGLIEECKRRLAEQLKGEMLPTEAERVRYLATIDKYKKENEELKQKVVSLNQTVSQANTRLAQAQTTPANTRQTGIAVLPGNTTGANAQQGQTQANAQRSASAKTYVIQSGDTLSKISQKVYGNKNRWQEIYQANKDTIKKPENLKVGQEIVIP